jgi:hypothetical protein
MASAWKKSRTWSSAIMIITNPRSASMDSRRVPGFARLAGAADFLASNNSKDEGMKRLNCPASGGKMADQNRCRIAIVRFVPNVRSF